MYDGLPRKWWRCSPGVVSSRRRKVRFIVSGVPKPQALAICSMVLFVVSSRRHADSLDMHTDLLDRHTDMLTELLDRLPPRAS